MNNIVYKTFCKNYGNILRICCKKSIDEGSIKIVKGKYTPNNITKREEL